MELSINQHFPGLASFWGIKETALHGYWDDLNAGTGFLASINDAIRPVPEFNNVQFSNVSQMRAYRCLLYLATRVLRPDVFIETGVHNGMSSAFILLGMQHNQAGHLHSIDLPPVDQRILDQGTNPLPAGRTPGWIIPDDLRSRHTLLLGPAETLLPVVLAEKQRVDIFLHDSDHSYAHIMLEAALAWPKLTGHGCIIVDNIEQNEAFSDFARGVDGKAHTIATFDGPDRVWRHGLLRR
jgi:hypothetical protein